jgi:hypothetical protein
MKRIVLLLVVTAFLMVALAVPAFADAGGSPNGGNSGVAHFCQELAPLVDITRGECTSYFAR